MPNKEHSVAIKDIVAAYKDGKNFVFTQDTDNWQRAYGTETLSYIIVPNKSELMAIYRELHVLEISSVFRTFYEPLEVMSMGDTAPQYHYIEILE